VDIITLLLDKGMSVNVNSELGQTPLHSAALLGSLRATEVLVRRGAAIDKTDGGGRTAVMYAARNGRLEVFRFLVENGADVNVSSRNTGSPLYQATVKGQLEEMQYLLDNGADVNGNTDDWFNRPLYAAAVKQNLQTVKLLIERRADVNISTSPYDSQSPSPLHAAAQYGNLEIMDCLIKAGANVNVLDPDGATPLFCAVARDKTEAVIHFIENGADVNTSICADRVQGWSTLHAATYYGNLEIMDCLIKAGANVNVLDYESATPLLFAVVRDKTEAAIHLIENGANVNICADRAQGWSPLHAAAQCGNLEIMNCLIKAGANVNVLESNGATPLYYAVGEDKTEAVIHLIENGADVNLCAGGFKGRSPLHAAALYGNLEIMDCLIKARAIVNVLDSDGATPLYYAVAKGKTEAVIHLIENGANVNRFKGGRPPIIVAALNRNLEITKFLIEAGANLNVLFFTGLFILLSFFAFFFSVYTALYFSLSLL
jgi:ankyrin repeat protein